MSATLTVELPPLDAEFLSSYEDRSSVSELTGPASAEAALARTAFLESMVSLDRPLLEAECEAVLRNLIDSYVNQDLSLLPDHERRDAEATIAVLADLDKPPYTLHLLDDASANACIVVKEREVFVNVGLFRAFQEHAPQAGWDGIAIILGHELAHSIYATRFRPEGAAARATSHDEENYCDQLGLRMADTAGYNVYHGGFDWLPKEQRESTKSMGLGSTHPNLFERHLEIREFVRAGIWQNYEERATRPFTKGQVEELGQQTALERVSELPEELRGPSRVATLRTGLDWICRTQFVIDTEFELSTKSPDELKDIVIAQPLMTEGKATTAQQAAYGRFVEEKLPSGQSIREAVFERLEAHSPELTGEQKERYMERLFLGCLQMKPMYIAVNDERTLVALGSHLREPSLKQREFRERQAASDLTPFDELLGSSEYSPKARAFLGEAFASLTGKSAVPARSFEELREILEEVGNLEGVAPQRMRWGAMSRWQSATFEAMKFSVHNALVVGAMRELEQGLKEHPKSGPEQAELARELLKFRRALDDRFLGFDEGKRSANLEFFHEIPKEVLTELMITTLKYGAPEDSKYIENYLQRSFADASIATLTGPPEQALALLEASRGHPIKPPLDSTFVRYYFSPEQIAHVMHYATDADIPMLAESLRHAFRDKPLEERNGIRKQIDALAERMERALPNVGPADSRILRESYASILVLAHHDRDNGLPLEIIKKAVDLGYAGLETGSYSLKDLGDPLATFKNALASTNAAGRGELASEILAIAEKRGDTELHAELLSCCWEALGASPLKDTPLDALTLPLGGTMGVTHEGEIYLPGFKTGKTPVPMGYGKQLSFYASELVTPGQNGWGNSQLGFSELAGLDDSQLARLSHIGPRPARLVAVAERVDRLDKRGELNADAVASLALELDQHGGRDATYTLAPLAGRVPAYRDGISSRKPELDNDLNGSPAVSLSEFALLRMIGTRGLDEIKEKPPEERLEWTRYVAPEPSVLRDSILRRLFADQWQNLDLSQQRTVLQQFSAPEAATLLRVQAYEQHKGGCRSLEEQRGLLTEMLPQPSPIRDSYLDEIHLRFQFSVPQYLQTAVLLTENSRQAQQADSIITGTLGSAITRMEAKDKVDLLMWLTSNNPEKPKAIKAAEVQASATLDELNKLFAVPTFRHELTKTLLAGSDGLLLSKNRAEMDRLLEQMIGPVLAESPSDSPAARQMKKFAGSALKAIFHLDNVPKRERIFQALLDAAYEGGGRLEPEKLIAVTLQSYGVVGVKLGQLLASRPEIRESHPELYRALEKLKDGANPLSAHDLMKVVMRNPALRESDLVVKKRVGSASIKGVFEGHLDGEDVMLKALRLEAGKELAIEESDFAALQAEIAPALREIFGVKEVPDLAGRIFRSIRLEVDFAQEVRNARELGEEISRYSGKRIQFGVPAVHGDYTNQNLIVEKKAPGTSLAAFLENHRQAGSAVGAEVQRSVLEQLARGGIVHGDLHSKNVFVCAKPGGGYIVTLIDCGFCVRPSEPTKNLLTDLALSRLPLLGGESYYRRAIERSLPEDVASRESERIRAMAKSFTKLPFEAAVLGLIHDLDQLPGYSTPDDLYFLSIGLLKDERLTQAYARNALSYAKLYGGRYLSAVAGSIFGW